MPLRSLVKSVLAAAGWKLVRIDPRARPRENPFQDQRLLFQDRAVRTIFDIGANHGQTALRYRELFPNATIHSFEPFEQIFEQLRHNTSADSNTHAHRTAVSNFTGTSKFHINVSHYTNSLLASSAAGKGHVDGGWTDTVTTTEVPTITLDEFCGDEKIDCIDILKIDVQGAEMLVLQGARKLLDAGGIDLVFAEVLFAPIYENQTDFCEMMSFLRQRGYVLYGLYDLFFRENLPISWADAIFVSASVADRLNKTATTTAAQRVS